MSKKSTSPAYYISIKDKAKKKTTVFGFVKEFGMNLFFKSLDGKEDLEITKRELMLNLQSGKEYDIGVDLKLLLPAVVK